MKKFAKDLKQNDLFMHNELGAWKAMQDAVKATEHTVKLMCWNTRSMKTKLFEFGSHVDLDMVTQ